MSANNELSARERRDQVQPKDITKERAAKLKRSMSLPEVLLWNQLKGGQLGFSFRRQHALGPFIADFYCHEVLLVVEVDGKFHYNQMDADSSRDAWLREHGFEVCRIDAKVVLEHPASAAHVVKLACERRAASAKQAADR